MLSQQNLKKILSISKILQFCHEDKRFKPLCRKAYGIPFSNEIVVKIGASCI